MRKLTGEEAWKHAWLLWQLVGIRPEVTNQQTGTRVTSLYDGVKVAKDGSMSEQVLDDNTDEREAKRYRYGELTPFTDEEEMYITAQLREPIAMEG